MLDPSKEKQVPELQKLLMTGQFTILQRVKSKHTRGEYNHNMYKHSYRVCTTTRIHVG